MKLSSISVALLQISCIASTAIAQQAETEELDDNNPSFALEYDMEPSHTRYIVKYKPGSKEFEERMHRARRRLSSSDNLRRTTTTSSSGDDTALLTYGSFLPKDFAEVVYMDSDDELKKWNEKEDVEFIEPGMYTSVCIRILSH